MVERQRKREENALRIEHSGTEGVKGRGGGVEAGCRVNETSIGGDRASWPGPLVRRHAATRGGTQRNSSASLRHRSSRTLVGVWGWGCDPSSSGPLPQHLEGVLHELGDTPTLGAEKENS